MANNVREIKFEEKIEDYLTTQGGYIKSNEIGYESLRGYKPCLLYTSPSPRD